MTASPRSSLWVLACLGFLLISRLPAIDCAFELDRDESQMAAQAMRYEHDLTPWRSVEGETNGPLDSWLILAAHRLGMPYRYRALHFLAFLCLAATLLATADAARTLAGRGGALCAVAAGAWWLGLSPVEQLVHYASELVPILLLSLAAAAAARARAAPGRGGAALSLAAGLFLGLAPWAKLQAGPVALALGLWALSGAVRSRRRKDVAALVAGALAPAALFLLWLASAGALEEFWRAYVLGGLYHGRARAWTTHLANLWDLLAWHPASPWFWDAALLAAAALALQGRRFARGLGLLISLWLAAALFAALRPITQWAHYALFCLSPLMLIAAGAGRALLELSAGRRRLGQAALVLGILPLPVAHFLSYHYQRAIAGMMDPQDSHAFDGQIFLAQLVHRLAPQAGSLAVWGWKPSLYVDLQIPPATRNAVNAFLTDPNNPSCGFLRERFLSDLEAAPPDAIVDVEDYIYRRRRQDAPETFPAFAAFLQSRYALVQTVEAGRSRDYTMLISVYVRR